MRAAARVLALAAVLAVAPVATAFAQGDQTPSFVTADAIAVRFFAPDMGGAAKPRFITTRQLSFEARLFALEEDPSGVVQPRHVRAALDAHVAEEMLGALPLEPAPDAKTVSQTVDVLRGALEQRVGGPAAIERAEKLEGITSRELDAIFVRQAHAALYVDRALSPILLSTEDQLRETYRTTSHPFRGRRFEEIRDDLARWMVLERFRSAEQSYLQSARGRITIAYV